MRRLVKKVSRLTFWETSMSLPVRSSVERHYLGPFLWPSPTQPGTVRTVEFFSMGSFLGERALISLSRTLGPSFTDTNSSQVTANRSRLQTVSSPAILLTAANTQREMLDFECCLVRARIFCLAVAIKKNRLIGLRRNRENTLKETAVPRWVGVGEESLSAKCPFITITSILR